MSYDTMHILTGAPGTGKTAVIEHRGFRYFDTVGEPAREILSERRVPGQRGGFHGPAEEFHTLLLERSILKHKMAMARQSALTLFDRGVPDCIAYALYMGVDPTPSVEAASAYRYAPEVFVFTPWKEIYTTDFDRIMTFDMTVEFHERVLEAYDVAGYDVIEVPQTRLIDRVEFVIDHLEAREAISRLR